MNTLHHTSKPLRLALVGRSLGHSFSQKYFSEKFARLGFEGATYTLIEVPALDNISEIVSERQLDGFNVTIPYKCQIMEMLDETDPVASEIGAVNTVAVRREMEDGRWKMVGYNTDAPAFLETLRQHLKPQHRRALIMGTGGASKAAAWALQRLGIEHLRVSRAPLSHPGSISYEEAGELVSAGSHNILINATPSGMFPNSDATPWPFPELINSSMICYDMIYNPSPTLFLHQAAEHGATTIDGLEMLHLQADLAFEIWMSPQ